MRRHKKLIIAAVLATVLVAGSIGGIALAQENEEGGIKAKFGDFITKVCDIYDKNVDPDIDREALQAAIDDVRTQMAADRAEMRAAMGDRPEMDPEAMKEHLDALLAEDKITQEQYDKIIDGGSQCLTTSLDLASVVWVDSVVWVECGALVAHALPPNK